MIFVMEKIVKIPVFSLVIIAIICHTHALTHDRIPHHKVRHKHNILHFNEDHVNEIREAFDDYKNTLHKPKVSKVSFDDVIKVKSLRNHREHDQRLSDDLTQSATVNDESTSRHFMTRYKRVHMTAESTTQGKAADINYDEEYDDENDDKSSSRNEGDVKVQETETAGLTLTDRKMEQLSTREGVQRSFEQETKKQRNNQQEIATNYDQATIFRHIRENIMRTKIDGMCRWPNKKVIEMPQHVSKMYTPRKYVIYQCSDETACCGSSEKTCVAKRAEELVLWFNVRTVGSTGYESLKVQNHTECECLYRNRQTSDFPRTFNASRVSQTLPRTTTPKARTQQCKCPSFFDLEVDNDGVCGCFCRNGKGECRRRYEGKEGFTISDQRCIKHRACQQPHCLYGTYSFTSGRCTDRNEKIRRGFQRPIRETKLRY